MSLTHAVVWIDHESAKIFQVDRPQTEPMKVKTHHHYTRQHGSEIRTQHEFFAQVCDAVAGVSELLIAGSQNVHTDFHHFITKHRPALIHSIIRWEAVDRPTERQLAAFGRKFFAKHDRGAAESTVS
jgi:stalled ribosome rescue protein Dom34